MSIASEITRLQNAKSALATSIGNKGVTVPASTKLDGYPALVDQIQTGGGGGTADDGVWHRPSNWPDYTKIPMSSIGTSEVYLTYDCRYAKAGIEPKGVCFKAYATGGYKAERGYIDSNGFVAVASENHTSSTQHKELLPTNEGDFVVYRITPQTSGNNISSVSIDDWVDYIGSARLYSYSQPCIEVYGKLEYATSVKLTSMFTISVSVVLKSLTGNIGNLFTNAYELVNVDTTGWVLTSVTGMNSWFYGDYALKYIDVSNWDVSNVTNMQQMFSECKSLRDLDVSKWDTGKVTNMYMTFRNMNLADIDISDWDFSVVTNAVSMFDNMGMVTKIDCNTTLTSIPASMFSSLRWCTTYIFRSTTLVTLANVNAFNNYNTSMKIYVPDALVNSYKTASNWSNFASYIYPLSEYTP